MAEITSQNLETIWLRPDGYAMLGEGDRMDEQGGKDVYSMQNKQARQRILAKDCYGEKSRGWGQTYERDKKWSWNVRS